jgi:zinc transporter ZupT
MRWSPVIIYASLAALANIMGGLWISSKTSLNPRLLRYLIAVGAGFMLAAVFLKVLPTSLALPMWQGKSQVVMLLVLIGYLSIHFFEHTLVAHFHFGEETHSEAMLSRHAAFTATGGLAIHTLFDGVSITSGFAININLGILVFIAILLHKLPEGFTVASIMLASGRSRATARWASVFVGLVTLFGAVLTMLLAKIEIYALPISAGVTLYVATSDLIPEVNTGSKRTPISLAVFGGVAFYYATETFLHFLYPSL